MYGTSGQDGVYNITMDIASIPLDKDLGFGVSTKSFQQDVRNLYPQQDRDNYDSDPEPTITHLAAVIGEVITNNKKKSITKESLGYFMQGQQVGFAALVRSLLVQVTQLLLSLLTLNITLTPLKVLVL